MMLTKELLSTAKFFFGPTCRFSCSGVLTLFHRFNPSGPRYRSLFPLRLRVTPTDSIRDCVDFPPAILSPELFFLAKKNAKIEPLLYRPFPMLEHQNASILLFYKLPPFPMMLYPMSRLIFTRLQTPPRCSWPPRLLIEDRSASLQFHSPLRPIRFNFPGLFLALGSLSPP